LISAQIIVIGGSLGGIHAVNGILQGLPKDYPLPIAVVLHRSAKSPDYTESLSRSCALPVVEPNDKDIPRPGMVYLAAADYHLLFNKGQDTGVTFGISTASPVNYARPSIDVFFESAAEAYNGGCVGIILTGMGSDGARGLAKIKSRGGYTIVQDAKTAREKELPEAAIKSTTPHEVLSLEQVIDSLLTIGNRLKESTCE
jgi:two-component system, chemotaxis family, protein-glutamate methylesterase/glutaminase